MRRIDFVDSMRRHGFAGELTMIERLPGQPLGAPAIVQNLYPGLGRRR